MINALFKFYQVNWQKLESYGFQKIGDQYQFETKIVDGRFSLYVFVGQSGVVTTKTIDHDTQDEYVLHLLDDSVGQFVGRVRTEIEKVLVDVRDHCFDKEIFHSVQAKQIVAYVREKYGDELEYLWEKFPDNAIWRRQDNRKWYGLILTLSKRKLGIDSDESADIIVLRIEPNEVVGVVDSRNYFPAYHMNKQHWFTICLDGRVPIQTICDWLDKSYVLAQK